MKIALLTYSTKPRGGVVHTLALAEALADLGQEVHVWTLARGGDTTFFRKVDPAVTIKAVEFPDKEGEDVGTRIARSIQALRDAFSLERDRYDIVHAQDCISANAALPCIRTIHHLDNFTTPELVACHERAVVAPTARICVSRAVADEVAKGWGLNPVVIPNGVDSARFEAGASDAVGRAGWRGSLGRYVLALGGIEPRKGSIDLLEAFARIAPAYPGLNLAFGGGETLFDYRDYRDSFNARALELGIEPQIVGVLDDDELPALVAEASALAMVSNKEGFGLAAMEALAAGVPVVARELPVLREVFGDEIRYASTVGEIATQLAQAVDCAANDARESGRELARSYTWQRAAEEHLAFYESLAVG
ncbi:MSMEG_0565 family glycosyltransferase [Nocardioides cavernaquae]|uniref:MSMEG_0565 family glycosyltransferase n=1 Tax=Nocardioides cavernaquae TaxID=2321396 RepID=A0A3A5HCJ5_9ACTN|nr:MSMEG_0565 family glycosyltransferase [Nocardioides cavernaquae]RJS45707.1 MSMEG_0565 family glycosyltransferase [Nocardioides cavernaquae]